MVHLHRECPASSTDTVQIQTCSGSYLLAVAGVTAVVFAAGFVAADGSNIANVDSMGLTQINLWEPRNLVALKG